MTGEARQWHYVGTRNSQIFSDMDFNFNSNSKNSPGKRSTSAQKFFDYFVVIADSQSITANPIPIHTEEKGHPESFPLLPEKGFPSIDTHTHLTHQDQFSLKLQFS